MTIKKTNDTYDQYVATISFAELEAFRDGCRKLGGPIADESAKAIDWYIVNVLPAPGETKDEKDDAGSDDLLPDAGVEPGPGDQPGEPKPEPDVKLEPGVDDVDAEPDAEVDELLPATPDE